MNYRQAYESFDLAHESRRVFGAGTPNVNVAVLCCDRYCGGDRLALRWTDEAEATARLTFEQLSEQSQRLARVLTEQGVGPGDRVACLLPRVPELVVTLLAVWRIGAVYQPLFTAFGPKAIEHRLNTAGARVVVTNTANRSKLDSLNTPPLTVLTVCQGGCSAQSSDIDFHEAVMAADLGLPVVERDTKDPFLIMFTSGTTGPAKPVLLPISALLSFEVYMRLAVGLHDDDRFWNIADPGWAYGLWYAVTGPLLMGQAITLFDGAFTVESLVRVVEQFDINNLAGAPTAYRALIAAGPKAVDTLKGRLRAVSSAGEPLNPEVIRWFAKHLAVTIHDHYGQTEMGMSLCNHHALEHPVTAGAAGVSLPGYRVVVVDEQLNPLPAGQPGVLAIDLERSPLFWFSGYEGMETKSLQGRYYLSGDTAECNADGTISFIGRDDDVITSAGYRIGPFDVESALVEHEAVVESAVVGKPDPERTEIVKAYVVLGKGWTSSAELEAELKTFVRNRLSAHAYPREFEFVENLPKTPSGKIQRFILRSQEQARSQEMTQ